MKEPSYSLLVNVLLCTWITKFQLIFFREGVIFADGVILTACRFCGLVKEILTDAVGSALELEGEIDGDTLEVSHVYG